MPYLEFQVFTLNLSVTTQLYSDSCVVTDKFNVRMHEMKFIQVFIHFLRIERK
jgi:hypothetical protein